MNTTVLLPVFALIAPAFLPLLGSRAFAQSSGAAAAVAEAGPLPSAPDFAPSAAWLRVLHDEPGDGRLWAVGATWKASFGAEGAVYYPRVGSKEPRKLPLALSPDLVTLGGESIAFERAAQAVRDGDRIELDRGSFTERYDCALESLEQSFVFETLPRAGDLVLRIPVASELDAVESAEGLEFRSDRGRITYSRAVVVDARGRRTDAATRIENGSLTIRVSADVLADAELPLVVDPILNAIFPDSTTDDTFSIDTAFDAFNNVWVVAYELVFSASDHDVIAKMYSATGTLIATASVDVTADSWVRPRIANLAFPHQFLVAAGVTASSNGAKTVKGRTVQPNGTILTVNPQFSVSGTLTGACIRPDVGGDPFQGPQAFYCVVFQQDTPGLTHDNPDQRIAYSIVNSAGIVISGPNFIAPSAVDELLPSVSKSNDGNEWIVAWQRSTELSPGDIMAAHLQWDGTVLDGPFTVASGFSSVERAPCASSAISGTRRTAIAFTRGTSSRDILVALIDGPSVVQTINLTQLENAGPPGADQKEPSIDSDGQHFLVSYSEFDPVFIHYKLFISDLAMAGDTLRLSQNHLEIQPGLGLSQLGSNVAAARTTGALAHRYLVVYDVTQNDVNHDVRGRFVEGLVGGPVNGFCFGDTTGAACPCGNFGSDGHGCANSVFQSGARLQLSSGPASTLADTAVVQVTSVPPNVSCLFFQGTTAGAGAAFGDGLRCATGTVSRIAAKQSSSSGIASYPGTGDVPLSVAGGVPQNGGLRTYQAWYRNAANFCTSATFNLSNGLAIHWAR